MIRTDLPPLAHGHWTSPETWLPAPEQLAQGAEALAAAGPVDGLEQLLGGLGAPLVDLVGAPFEARASLLAAASGGAFLHHERLVRLPVPEALAPELAVWDGETVPEWRGGVLEEPKYFGFRQDARLPAFNPNHRRRWRPHELLHGAVGFFWRPDMPRFELYLGARLNELLPVVHWYGTAEPGRARCPAHLGKPLDTELCPACEAAAAPYWETGRGRVRGDAALAFAAHAVEHLGQELRTIHQEHRTGRRLATPRAGLDASSDAVGYLRGHWNRLVAWSMGAWVEGFLEQGVDYESTVDDLGQRVASTAGALWGGSLEVEPARAEALRARRLLQELGYRAMVCLEWLEPGSAAFVEQEAALYEELEAAREAIARLQEGAMAAATGLGVAQRLAQALDEAELPEHLAGLPGAMGASWWRAASPAEVALPSGVAEVGELASLAEELVGSEVFASRGDLGQRFGRWLDQPGGGPGEARSRLTTRLRADLIFEAWLRALPHQDLDADRFSEGLEEAGAPQDEGGLEPWGSWSTLRTHRSLRVRAWPARHAARWLADEDGPATDLPTDPDGAVQIAVAWVEELPQVLALDEAMLTMLQAVQDPSSSPTPLLPEHWEALELLVAAGHVVLVRPPR